MVLLLLIIPILDRGVLHLANFHDRGFALSPQLLQSLSEFICQTMLVIWFISFPAWLIGIIYNMILKEKIRFRDKIYVFAGFIGQVLLFVMSYFQYLNWN